MAKPNLAKPVGGPPTGVWSEAVPPVTDPDMHSGRHGQTDTAAPPQGLEARALHTALTDAQFNFSGLAGAANAAPGSGTTGATARAEHSNSFIRVDIDFGDHPALQNNALIEALERAREKIADRFSIEEALPDPVVIDGDMAGARAAGGGGKGRSKTPTEQPVSEPAPTPTPTTTAPTTADYTSGLDTPNGFNIGLVYAGTGWTDALKQAFQQATEFLSDIIKGDLASVTTAAGVIDDMRITVSLTTIDGAGGFAGWGGYTAARSGSFLPYDGYVKMDSADAASLVSMGIWDDFALHEMLHALGFGTAWNAMGLVRDYGGDLRFIGTNATRMYNTEYPLIAGPDPLSDYGVPVETDGGSGTAGVHWDDNTFKNEIMTGALDLSNNLSDMTIAALQDMGYQTIYVEQHALS